jgi:magnesium-transporting ATPase (P-type)
MTPYKHTQIGYLMIIVSFIVFVLFAWMQITARAEAPSVDSGTNFLFTAIMLIVLVILTSFATLTVSIKDNFLKVKFGYGIFRKKFLLSDIVSATQVRNPWYCGWGIRLCISPYMWIYNVSGFHAVEIKMKNGKVYRIGTDEPEKLLNSLKQATTLF